ncbi:class I SAM-dependent methyltransferase [Salinibaculum rarum]|uniref:class I SAM-dependent methyltransferase n=1 Tax=Salinibaculum rarum TaxID=3058903 RepID=UPI00265E6D0D|nr:methyltransferase domain-containing protein [Salinibaculum sp. KK48]
MAVGDVSTFDRFARVYDLLMPAARRSKLQAGLALAERPVERVVDVGGGPGRAVRAIDADCRVVADPARGMLAQAQTHGLGAVQGDGSRLPIRNSVVDAVIVSDALHHIADQRGVLEEARRVLRPGGVLVVREFDPTTLRGRALVAAERVWGFDSTFYSPDALRADVDAVGLDGQVVEHGFGYTVAGVARTENGNPKAEESE